ncbi:hypothetical protein [Tenacibaculum finnmarkense]|nr:hypothetical protein [Tenacibaculum finnmarkense]
MLNYLGINFLEMLWIIRKNSNNYKIMKSRNHFKNGALSEKPNE